MTTYEITPEGVIFRRGEFSLELITPETEKPTADKGGGIVEIKSKSLLVFFIPERNILVFHYIPFEPVIRRKGDLFPHPLNGRRTWGLTPDGLNEVNE